jgi:hypothetical protein
MLMEMRCRHVVIEFLPLRLLGRLLPRTSQNSFKANFRESPKGEVRRIPLPRTSVNKLPASAAKGTEGIVIQVYTERFAGQKSVRLPLQNTVTVDPVGWKWAEQPGIISRGILL